MKDVFNLKNLFPRNDDKYLLEYNYIGDQIILSVFTILFCLVGLVGNGNIIWLLGFHIKRKPFANYILNLAVADFGFLVLLLPLNICSLLPAFDAYLAFPTVLVQLFMSLFVWMYTSRQHLLTAISIDRWVSVFFPNWYQCHRSPVSTITVCAFVWVLSFALIGVPFFLIAMPFIPDDYRLGILLCQCAISLMCLLLVILSTLTLLIKVCSKSPRCHCGTPLKVILLILLSSFWLHILIWASFIMFSKIQLACLGLWTSLKSSITPLIYFLAGRQNRGKFQERMKLILQRVFKEERDTRMELQLRTQKVL